MFDYKGLLIGSAMGLPIGAGLSDLGIKMFGTSHKDLDPLTYSHQAIEVAHEGFLNINDALGKILAKVPCDSFPSQL